VALISTVLYNDRVNLKSWRTFSLGASLNGSGVNPTLRSEVCPDPAAFSLRQLCLTWDVPATALSARLFGTVYVDLNAGYDVSHPEVDIHWRLLQAAWGAGDPGYDPPGTVLASATSTTPPGQPQGLITILNGLEIPVTALGLLQLVIEDTIDFAGDPFIPGTDNRTSNVVIPLAARGIGPGELNFQIDFRTEAPAGSSRPAFPGGPGGGNW
jgi:hypothetical protein